MKQATGFFAALLMMTLPQPASAHLVGVELGDFYAGVLHLTLAIEQVVALLVLGLVAAMQPQETARWMLLALPLGLIAGICATLVVAPPASMDPAVAASLFIPGIIGVAAFRLRIVGVVLLALAVGGVLGFANGLSADEVPVDWLLYASGVVVAGTAIGTRLISLATVVSGLRSWVPLAERVLCSWFAAAGAIFFAFSVTSPNL